MMIIEQYAHRSRAPLGAGKHVIEVITDIKGPGQPGSLTLMVDGKQVGMVTLKRTVPAAFTATETFDVGVDLGSPVSQNYYDRRPFAFDGKIDKLSIARTTPFQHSAKRN